MSILSTGDLSTRGLDLRLVQAFVAVAREGSVSRAATALGYSQPAVTQQLQDFERLLGCAVIERGCIPLRLTPAGRERLPVAEAILLMGSHLVPPTPSTPMPTSSPARASARKA